MRKSSFQNEYMIKIFRSHNGKVPKEVRKLAAKETGQTGQQVNKWIYDQKVRESKDLKYHFGIIMDRTIVFTVIGKDGKFSQPIFKLERVKQTVMGSNG